MLHQARKRRLGRKFMCRVSKHSHEDGLFRIFTRKKSMVSSKKRSCTAKNGIDTAEERKVALIRSQLTMRSKKCQSFYRHPPFVPWSPIVV